MTEATVAVLPHRWQSPGDHPAIRLSTPFWLNDDTILGRALAVKRHHPPSAAFWDCLAELVRTCRSFVAERVHDGIDVTFAGSLVRSIAVELPAPGVALHDPRRPGSFGDAFYYRPDPAADLADLTSRLAVALADPRPTDLDLLAFFVDELDITLILYRFIAEQVAPSVDEPCTGPDPP